jgi:disulfide bond formation protein DsbB
MAALGLYLAWLTSLVATSGSLYLSEVRHFVPCTLCWYQRILMYPLIILLGIASYRQDRAIVRYTVPLSVLGIVVALYHVLEQNIPGFGSAALCRAGVPCSLRYINALGFITIPVLSLTAFTLITLFLALAARRQGSSPA